VNILTQLGDSLKAGLGMAVTSAELNVVSDIGQVPVVQQAIQSQIDLKVQSFSTKAIVVVLIVIGLVLVFKRGKS